MNWRWRRPAAEGLRPRGGSCRLRRGKARRGKGKGSDLLAGRVHTSGAVTTTGVACCCHGLRGLWLRREALELPHELVIKEALRAFLGLHPL